MRMPPASSHRASEPPAIITLGIQDAGEVLTLQRAAYITEAVAHDDFSLPPLTQTLVDLKAEISAPEVTAVGIGDNGRLIGAVRLRRIGSVIELGRLTVARIAKAKVSAPPSCGTPRWCSLKRRRYACSPASAAPPTSASTPGTVTRRPVEPPQATTGSSTSPSRSRSNGRKVLLGR